MSNYTNLAVRLQTNYKYSKFIFGGIVMKDYNKKMALRFLKSDMVMLITLMIGIVISYIVGGMYTLAMLSIVWIPMTLGFMGQTIKSWRLYLNYKRHDFKDRADW